MLHFIRFKSSKQNYLLFSKDVNVQAKKRTQCQQIERL
jgi:hypothetical protein